MLIISVLEISFLCVSAPVNVYVKKKNKTCICLVCAQHMYVELDLTSTTVSVREVIFTRIVNSALNFEVTY